MKVYRNGVEIFEIKDYRQTGRFMEVATIDATVKTPTPFEFKIGDYVIFDYNGLTYTIYDVAPAKKQARSGTYGEAFTYELRFKADTEQLAICPFLDLVINDNLLSYTSLPSFTTFENVYGIADRLQANMDSLYPGKWRFDVVQTDDAELLETLGEAMEFSISGESCLEGLKKIYDTWGVSFIHTFEDGINVITLGKSAGTTSAFRYGKGQGLRTVKKNLQNTDQLCTRAYVYGSTRNIHARWYNDKEYIGETQYAPNLMIPPSKWVNGIPQGAYIDAIFDGENRIEKYGLKIKTFSYDGSDGNKDEIYPSIEKITAGIIRTVKEDLGEEENVPSIHLYPDSERMDMVLEGTKITDDGTATDPGYVLWSDKYNAIVKPETIVYPIAEQIGETKYKLLTLQKSFNLCSFDIVKTSRYQIHNEFNDFVKFKKNDLESTISAALYLQKPSGASIELRKLIFTDTLEGSLQLPNLEYSLDEVGKYTLVVKFNVSWSVDYVTPQFGDDVTLEYSIPTEYNVVLARGQKILPSDFTIKIKQIGFDINNYTASNGASKSIHVKSGMCAGRTFGIKQCTYSEEDDSWVLLCRRIDDSSVSQRFPNSAFPISKEDQFILININMPDLYVYAAMQRLYDTAYADLEYFSRPQYVIEPEIDNLQMARSPQVIKEGMYMPIEEIDLDYVEETLIDSVTITNRGTELRTFEVTLRNDKVYNKYAKLASRIAELESSLQQANSNANVIPAAEGTDNVVVQGGGGGGSYDLLESWEFYDENKREALGANLGYELKQDLEEGLTWDEYKDGEGGGGSSEPNEGVVSETKLVKYITDYVEYLGLKYIEDGDYLKATKPIVSEEEIISCSRAEKTDSDAGGDTGEDSNPQVELTSEMIVKALGYTPYNAANPQGFITSEGLDAYAKQEDVPSLEGYAKQSWVQEQKYLTSVPEEYVTEQELNSKGYATVADVQNVASQLGGLEERFELLIQTYNDFVGQHNNFVNSTDGRLSELEAFELSLETIDETTYLRSKYTFVSDNEMIASRKS